MFPHHSTSGKTNKDVFSTTTKKKLVEKRYNISSVWLSWAAWGLSCLLAITYCHFQMEDLASPCLTFPSSPNSSSCFLHPLPLPPTPTSISLQLNDGKLLQKTRQVCSCFFYQFFWSVPSFFFFFLYELIAMFLDWVVDIFFFGSFCICLDDGAVSINKKLGNLNVLGRFYG